MLEERDTGKDRDGERGREREKARVQEGKKNHRETGRQREEPRQTERETERSFLLWSLHKLVRLHIPVRGNTHAQLFSNSKKHPIFHVERSPK